MAEQKESAMTIGSDLPARLRAKIEQWQRDGKRETDRLGDAGVSMRAVYELCAEELEAELAAALQGSETAPPPIQIVDALHAVLTIHGITSRASDYDGLITGLVQWAAQACRQSQQAANAWLPIETAPKDGTPIAVAVFEPRFEWEKAHWWSGSEQQTGWWARSAFVNPTHWMPLPPAPARPDGA